MELEDVLNLGVAGTLGALVFLNRIIVRPKIRRKYKKYEKISIPVEHYFSHLGLTLIGNVAFKYWGYSSENAPALSATASILCGILWDGAVYKIFYKKARFDQMLSDTLGAITPLPFL